MPTLSRRAAIASGLAAMAATSATAMPLRLEPGVQLWTVKDELERDFGGTLKALHSLGYRRVESAGWHGRSAPEFRRGLQAAGLTCAAAHYGLAELREDTEAKLAFAREVGAAHVVISSPAPARPLPEGRPWPVAIAEAMTLADWRANIADINRIAPLARAAGLRLGYHNHAAELIAYEGVQPLAEIAANTDASVVDIELDVGWTTLAGADAVSVIEALGPRIRLLHLKDVMVRPAVAGAIAGDLRTTPVGQGVIDWTAVFDAARRRAKVTAWFVEQEPPFSRPPLEALRTSLDYLRRLA